MMRDPAIPIEPEEGRSPPLTVLITAIEMDERAGSTMYTHDLAIELAATGHRPIVYTPAPGSVSAELEAQGIEVVDRLDQMSSRPDVIHGNHTLETAEAVFRLPGTPVVFVCHGVGGWMAEPPRLAAVHHWVAVGVATADRLARAGLPAERCSLVPNGVDTECFRPTARQLPDRPRRALLFSNNASTGGYAESIAQACAARGIELDVAGKGVGRPLASPAEVLGDYDLVFARGRCAREAISCGCAVVLVDIEGQGKLVTTDIVTEYDSAAFGLAALTDPHDAVTLGREIDRYDPLETAEVGRRLRETSSVDAMVARLVGLYRDALAEPAPDPDPLGDFEWLLRQLTVMSAIGHDRDATHLARHLLQQHALELEARVAHAEPALTELQARVDDAETALGQADAALAELRATRTFRARERLLSARWVDLTVRPVLRKIASR